MKTTPLRLAIIALLTSLLTVQYFLLQWPVRVEEIRDVGITRITGTAKIKGANFCGSLLLSDPTNLVVEGCTFFMPDGYETLRRTFAVKIRGQYDKLLFSRCNCFNYDCMIYVSSTNTNNGSFHAKDGRFEGRTVDYKFTL